MINLRCKAICPADTSIIPRHSSQAGNLFTLHRQSYWYLELGAEKEAVTSRLWDHPGLTDKMLRNKVKQKTFQGGEKQPNKQINKQTLQCSQSKAWCSDTQNLSGLIGVQMIGFGGIWARFTEEMHAGNTEQDNWTTHVSLSEEAGTTSSLKFLLMA